MALQHHACSCRYSWFYTISPDACTNASIYWLGHYSEGRYDIENARGPERLDLGDVLYAPNVFVDDRGRTLLWGWLQERRSVSDLSGCTVLQSLFMQQCCAHAVCMPVQLL